MASAKHQHSGSHLFVSVRDGKAIRIDPGTDSTHLKAKLEENWGVLAPHEVVTMKWKCWGKLEHIAASICVLRKGVEEFAKESDDKEVEEFWRTLDDNHVDTEKKHIC